MNGLCEMLILWTHIRVTEADCYNAVYVPPPNAEHLPNRKRPDLGANS